MRESPGGHHAATTPANQCDVAQIFHFDKRDNVLDMGPKISGVVTNVTTLARPVSVGAVTV